MKTRPLEIKVKHIIFNLSCQINTVHHLHLMSGMSPF